MITIVVSEPPRTPPGDSAKSVERLNIPPTDPPTRARTVASNSIRGGRSFASFIDTGDHYIFERGLRSFDVVRLLIKS